MIETSNSGNGFDMEQVSSGVTVPNDCIAECNSRGNLYAGIMGGLYYFISNESTTIYIYILKSVYATLVSVWTQ